MKIILDTNFLIYCAKDKLDYESEIEKIINDNYELVVPKQVVIELEKIKNKEKEKIPVKKRVLRYKKTTGKDTSHRHHHDHKNQENNHKGRHSWAQQPKEQHPPPLQTQCPKKTTRPSQEATRRAEQGSCCQHCTEQSPSSETSRFLE